MSPFTVSVSRMPPPLPTVEGDVVIMYRQSVPTAYHVWPVIADGQQERDGTLFRPMRVGDQAAAEQLARDFVADTGTVFLYEQDTSSWTTLPRIVS